MVWGPPFQPETNFIPKKEESRGLCYLFSSKFSGKMNNQVCDNLIITFLNWLPLSNPTQEPTVHDELRPHSMAKTYWEAKSISARQHPPSVQRKISQKRNKNQKIEPQIRNSSNSNIKRALKS